MCQNTFDKISVHKEYQIRQRCRNAVKFKPLVYCVDKNRRLSRYRPSFLTLMSTALAAYLFIVASKMYIGDKTIRRLSEIGIMVSTKGVSIGSIKLSFDSSDISATAIDQRLSQRNLLDGCIHEHQQIYFAEKPFKREEFDRCRMKIDMATGNTLTVTSNSTSTKRGSLGAQVFEIDFSSEGPYDVDLASSGCEFFLMVEPDTGPLDATEIQSPARSKSKYAGELMFVMVASSLGYIREFQRALVNHVAYARDYGYGISVAIITSDILQWRSPKYGKHYAMGQLSSVSDWKYTCVVDWDAWFDSWEPVDKYFEGWPLDREIFIPDTGQVWYNSGFICVRNTPWSGQFFERVVNALHDPCKKDEAGPGFLRDQPALWHTIMQVWQEEGLIDYPAYSCSHWQSDCNPVSGPVTCWHKCFWDVLSQSSIAWKSPQSSYKLSHIHTPYNQIRPAMHRMCLTSCKSLIGRIAISVCRAVHSSNQSSCLEKDSQNPNMCDSMGCLSQLAEEDGAWLKHTGHHMWKKEIIDQIPLNGSVALAQ